MQVAWPQAMADVTVPAFAIADEDVAAWLFLQHEGKILGSHGGLHMIVDRIGPNDGPQHACCKFRFLRVIN